MATIQNLNQVLDAYEADLKAWAKLTRGDLRKQVQSVIDAKADPKEKGILEKSIRSRMRLTGDYNIEGISFSFIFYGFYVGVGCRPETEVGYGESFGGSESPG